MLEVFARQLNASQNQLHTQHKSSEVKGYCLEVFLVPLSIVKWTDKVGRMR